MQVCIIQNIGTPEVEKPEQMLPGKGTWTPREMGSQRPPGRGRGMGKGTEEAMHLDQGSTGEWVTATGQNLKHKTIKAKISKSNAKILQIVQFS